MTATSTGVQGPRRTGPLHAVFAWADKRIKWVLTLPALIFTIVVTQLPYMVGPEKVIEKIKDAVQAKKLTGISDVLDLTDRKHGLRMII